MNNVRAWRPLPAAHPDLPALLVAAEFGPDSYAVYVTDLAHVWAERLERRDICMRAFQEITTIDPSYSSEQMKVFLGKLRVALLDGEDADARLSLAAAGNGNLVLHTTTVLPAGLQPLQWPMYLEKQSPTAIASELVLPLIHGRAVQQHATTQLVAALRDKDAVINKLVDKLDAMGAGVESAFPTLLGAPPGGRGDGGLRRKITRADMERRVRGLAVFDEAEFRKRMRSTHGSSGGLDADLETGKLLGEAFDKDNELRYETDSGATTTPRLDSWWQELGSGRGVMLKRPVIKTTESSQGTTGVKEMEQTTAEHSEDTFQEPTPKRVRPITACSTPEPDDGPPSPTPVKAKANLGTSKPGRIGTIGKRPPATGPLPTSSTTAAVNDTMEDEDTASEADEPPNARKEAMKTAPNGAVVRPVKTGGGLGRIGGKSKQAPPLSVGSPARKELDRADKGEAAPGGAEQRAPADKEEEKTPVASAAAQSLSPQKDTSKRAEALQKAIQKHATPVHKKRKF